MDYWKKKRRSLNSDFQLSKAQVSENYSRGVLMKFKGD